AAFVILGLSFVVFIGIYTLGDPIDFLFGQQAVRVDHEQAFATLGLDRPFWMQYWMFLYGIVHGLPSSSSYGGSALALMLSRMPATLELATAALLVSALAGIPLGIWAGFNSRSVVARSLIAASVLGRSLPSFWVGLVLIMIFCVAIGWLPSHG